MQRAVIHFLETSEFAEEIKLAPEELTRFRLKSERESCLMFTLTLLSVLILIGGGIALAVQFFAHGGYDEIAEELIFLMIVALGIIAASRTMTKRRRKAIQEASGMTDIHAPERIFRATFSPNIVLATAVHGQPIKTHMSRAREFVSGNVILHTDAGKIKIRVEYDQAESSFSLPSIKSCVIAVNKRECVAYSEVHFARLIAPPGNNAA